MIEQVPTFPVNPEADQEALLRLTNVRLADDKKSLWHCKKCGAALRYRSYELTTTTLKATVEGHECINTLCSPNLPDVHCMDCGRIDCICSLPDQPTTEEYALNVRLNDKATDELFDAVFTPKAN